MKDLSITQEYMICAVNEKGAFKAHSQKAVVCLIVSGLLEMQMEKCISLDDKKITVCAELPETMTYLKPLYDFINQGKPVKTEKVIEAYTITFTSKRLNELTDAVMGSLKEADVTEPAKAGLLSHKEASAPKKEAVTGIIEKIRKTLLTDGEISEDAAALTALMDKAGMLNEYFSKSELKDLKAKLEEIKNSESYTLVKKMVQYIDELVTSMLVASAVAATI